MENISASDANRHFSKVLRQVSQGDVVTITSRGKPVASIIPAHRQQAQHSAARKSLLNRLRQQKITGERNWTRDELYDDECRE
jgi:prevent-host-death family protein